MTITEFITARLDEAMIRRQRKNPKCPCGKPTEPYLDLGSGGMIGFRHPIDPPPVFFDPSMLDFPPSPPGGFMVHEFRPGDAMYEAAQDAAFAPLADKPEYAALRRIAEIHRRDRMDDTCMLCETYRGSEWSAPFPCETFRAIASVWEDHPDYLKERA